MGPQRGSALTLDAPPDLSGQKSRPGWGWGFSLSLYLYLSLLVFFFLSLFYLFYVYMHIYIHTYFFYSERVCVCVCSYRVSRHHSGSETLGRMEMFMTLSAVGCSKVNRRDGVRSQPCLAATSSCQRRNVRSSLHKRDVHFPVYLIFAVD